MSNQDIGNNFSKSYIWLFLLFLFIAFSAYTFFSITLNSPMLASDEYAYLVSGKYLNSLNEVYKLDPYLQQVSNLLYFKIISVMSYFFGDNLVIGLRLLHVIEYFAAAFILYKTLEGFVDKKSLILSCVIFLLFPGAIYIYTIMPEIELILLGACFAYALLKMFPRMNVGGSIFTGFIVSLAILIKPHAIALLMTGLATVLLYPFYGCEGSNKKKFISAAINGSLLLISAYITFVIVWRICSSTWSFDPKDPLGLNFYGHYFVENPISIQDKLIGIFKYVVVNLVVLYLIFTPVFFWLIKSFIENFTDEDKSKVTDKLITLFFIMLIFSHVLMISYFTFNAGIRNDGESMRIHGRYLGCVIVLLIFLYFFTLNKIAQSFSRLLPISIFLNVLFFIFIIKFFKIYPWDYPLLFAFFNHHNFYLWDFEGCFKFIRTFLLAFVIFGSLIAFFKTSLSKKIIGLQILIIFLLGTLQTYSWLFSHLKSNENISSTSKSLKNTFMTNTPGKGVVGTNDRYGKSSYLLFNLANAPKVILKPLGENIGANDVLGADWVLLTDLYPVGFNYKNKINVNGLSLYVINSAVGITSPSLKTLEKGESTKLLLGRAHNSSAQLAGFNELEDWGVWSSEETSEIQLPFEMSDRIKIQIFGWILEENQNKLVQIGVDGVTNTVSFKNAGSIYDIELQLNHPTNKLNIHSSVVKPVNSHRNMGIAISYIVIERL